MYVQRVLEKTVTAYLDKREIIAITGPRQSGKTTLLKHLSEGLENVAFLDFEDRETLTLFNEDIKAFAELHVKPHHYLFIDEFQYAKEGGRNLKYLYDHFKTKILISGSSVSGLSIHGIKHLVGRILVFELHPFSFEEFLRFKEPELYENVYVKGKPSAPVIERIRPLFEEFCVYGGYPRVALSPTPEEKQLILRNIYNTYFLKEVREVLNIPDDYKLGRLIHALALQIGNTLNYHELSGLTSLPYVELLKNFNTLEKTFICRRSQPFYSNKRTELVKAPKIFFHDNGFRNAVLKDFQQVKDRPDKGALYENFVATELLKKQFELKYWRTKAKAEVDFVVEKSGKPIPIEVKSSLKQPLLTKSFQSFLQKYGPKEALVLSEKLCTEKAGATFRPIFYVEQALA